MFGLSKKRFSSEQLSVFLMDFFNDKKMIDTYKETLGIDSFSSNQLREILIYNMHATVYAIQSSIDSKELSKKIIDYYHTTAVQRLGGSNHKSQTAIRETVDKRYIKYFEIIQDAKNIENASGFFILADEFLKNFFQDKDNNSGASMTM